ncbi:MAG: hypothetical protein QM627_06420 [Luteolibacter sp.]
MKPSSVKRKTARSGKPFSAKEEAELQDFEKLVAQAGKLAANKRRATWKTFGENLHAAIQQA